MELEAPTTHAATSGPMWNGSRSAERSNRSAISSSRKRELAHPLWRSFVRKLAGAHASVGRVKRIRMPQTIHASQHQHNDLPEIPSCYLLGHYREG